MKMKKAAKAWQICQEFINPIEGFQQLTIDSIIEKHFQIDYFGHELTDINFLSTQAPCSLPINMPYNYYKKSKTTKKTDNIDSIPNAMTIIH